MAKLLVCYYTRSGHTKKMAELVADAIKGVEACQVDLIEVRQMQVEKLLDYDAILLGSPTYYGTMAAEIKQMLDDSVKLHGQLAGKVGGAFASSANVGGGNETTVLDLVKAMLIHGMIIPGSASGDHYGPVSVGQPDQRAAEQCQRLGEMIAKLTVRLAADDSN